VGVNEGEAKTGAVGEADIPGEGAAMGKACSADLDTSPAHPTNKTEIINPAASKLSRHNILTICPPV